MKTEPEAEEGSELRVLFATFMEETAGVRGQVRWIPLLGD